MNQKQKSCQTGGKPPVAAVPPMPRDAIGQNTSADAVARRRIVATQPASGTANHARHHVPVHSQS